MEALTPSAPPVERAPADAIVAALRRGGPALVALSGGVDSAVVALLAHRALGREARAVTLSSPAVSRREVDRAREVARAIGIVHEVVITDPLAAAEYRANPSNRCYFCRQTETASLRAWGSVRGIRRYLDGVHLDDLGDTRPGLRAMEEAGFEHPLAAAGWRKADIRRFARTEGLPNWDQPSDACLASRVRPGQPISAELLVRVQRAEERLLDRGFRRVRVRTDGRSARIEVDPDEVARLGTEPLATSVRAELLQLGFTDVVIDPHGYAARPGS